MLHSNTSYEDEQFLNLVLTDNHLRSSHFDECTFENCRFNQTQFQYGSFIRCTFIDCDLSLVSFPETRLRQTRFEGCKCVGINWTELIWEPGGLGQPLHFQCCILNYGIFMGLSLQGITFEDCQLQEVDFREADLSRCDFCDSDLAQALFQHTNLSRADLSNARNYSLDPRSNQVKGLKVSFPEALGLLLPLGVEVAGI